MCESAVESYMSSSKRSLKHSMRMQRVQYTLHALAITCKVLVVCMICEHVGIPSLPWYFTSTILVFKVDVKHCAKVLAKVVTVYYIPIDRTYNNELWHCNASSHIGSECAHSYTRIVYRLKWHVVKCI
jgi:hypothetical protein